jgi:hypothetical protein
MQSRRNIRNILSELFRDSAQRDRGPRMYQQRFPRQHILHKRIFTYEEFSTAEAYFET